MLRSVLVSLLLGVVATTAQLPPEIMLDGHLLRAEDAVRQRDPAAARAAMNQIEALQEQHELDAPATYHYRYASVWNALGAWDQSLASAVRYLDLTGRDGEHYLAALTLMNRATGAIEELERARELRAAEEAAVGTRVFLVERGDEGLVEQIPEQNSLWYRVRCHAGASVVAKRLYTLRLYHTEALVSLPESTPSRIIRA